MSISIPSLDSTVGFMSHLYEHFTHQMNMAIYVHLL